MGLPTARESRRIAGMLDARLMSGFVLLAQCLHCKAADVLISSTGREPIKAGVDVLGNGSIVLNIAEADWPYPPWLLSALASTLVSLSGVFPLVLIPLGFDAGPSKSGQGSGSTLRVMLSFAVGGLLGDVFLHLLPEAWSALPPSLPHSLTKDFTSRGNGQHIWTGMWVLVGMLVFIIVEKCCSSEKEDQQEGIEDVNKESRICKEKIAKTINNNFHEGSEHSELCDFENHSKKVTQPSQKKHVAGYLNLVANSIDNFTHGLAVGGGFYISLRVGIFTTLAILVHEVPHEIGDFAILMRSGFSRWDAARAQLLTGSAGVLGALAASIGAADEAGVSWILPFTAGGFLHIALVSVLPELASESNPRESAKQLISLAAGILLMAAITVFVES